MNSAKVCAIGYLLASSCMQQAQTPEGDPDRVEPVASVTEALNSVPVWADPSGNQTIAQGAGTVLTLSGSVKATGTLAARVLSGVTVVDQLATSGVGTAANPWAGWEPALNALPPGKDIYFPAGYYAQSATIQAKPGWTLRGAGNDASVITSVAGFAGDAIQSISPYNGSTAVRLLVQDLQLLGTNPTPPGAAIDIVAGSFIYIQRVYAGNYKYGAVLDQAELVDIEECEFSASITTAAAGVWIVDNAEHQAQHIAGVPSSPTPLSKFSSRIGVRKTQFNSVAFTGIMDDGGDAHTFEDNNLNGGATAIRLAGVSGARVTGNKMAWQTLVPIVSSNVTAQQGSTSGANVALHLANNRITDTQSAVLFVNGSSVTLANNSVDTNTTAFKGLANVSELTAFGNQQSGAGALFDADPVTGFVSSGKGVGVQTSNPGAELEINGGMRLFTTKTQPNCTAATRGEFWFVQGATNVKDLAVVCAKGAANNYLWRTLY